MRHSYMRAAWWTGMLASLGCCLAAMRFGGPVSPGVFKMLTSCCFLGLALGNGALRSGYGRGIMIGLFFSWWGDLFLIWSTEKIFLAGLVSFLLGHVAYGITFARRGFTVRVAVLTSVVLVPILVLVMRSLWGGVGADLQIPVIVYSTVITLMVCLAAGTLNRHGNVLILLGALAFYFSDVSVAIGRFGDGGFLNTLWGLPLYFLGQMLLAESVYRERFAREGKSDIVPVEP